MLAIARECLAEAPGPAPVAPRAPLSGALDLIPDPLVIVDRDGAVRAFNRAFALLPWRESGRPRRCCDILGCGTASTSWRGCLTAYAAAREGRTVVGRSVRDDGWVLWASATRLGGADDDAVLFRIRAAGPDGARHGGRPADTALIIRTLGATQVRRRDGRIDHAWLDQRPGVLLKYLVAARGRMVSGDEIAEALWPRLGASAPTTVRHAVHLLRRHLEPDRPPKEPSRFVLTRGGRYGLSPDTVWVDADAFESATRTGLDAFVSGRPEAAEYSLQQALNLYRGEFLQDDPYADWAFDERERLRSMAEVPLRLLAELHLRRGDLDGASAYVERLGRMEPFDEDVHRLLIALWLRQGKGSRALRHYEAFRARLRRQLGVVPAFDIGQIGRSDAPLHAL